MLAMCGFHSENIFLEKNMLKKISNKLKLHCDNHVPQWWVELSYLQKIAKSFSNFCYSHSPNFHLSGSTESFGKQPTQLIIVAHNCHKFLIYFHQGLFESLKLLVAFSLFHSWKFKFICAGVRKKCSFLMKWVFLP